MKIYDYTNYKEFVRQKIKLRPHGGRGEYLRLSKYLGVPSVVVSQIFKGKRELSSEQAYLVSQFLGLSKLEAEYFLKLTDYCKSQQKEYKKHLETELNHLKSQMTEIKNIIENTPLTESAKSIYYSDWKYSATRLAVRTEGLQTISSISNKLNLSANEIRKIIDFLIDHNLVFEENNKFYSSQLKTHLESNSPFIQRYHSSWRIKGFHNMDELQEHERFVTLPMNLTKEFMLQIKEYITELISKTTQELEKNKPNTIGCLNIDLFELKK